MCGVGVLRDFVCVNKVGVTVGVGVSGVMVEVNEYVSVTVGVCVGPVVAVNDGVSE